MRRTIWLAVLGSAAVSVLRAQAPEAEAPPQGEPPQAEAPSQPEPPVAERPVPPPPSEADRRRTGVEDDVFIPSEELAADEEATFPVDI